MLWCFQMDFKGMNWSLWKRVVVEGTKGCIKVGGVDHCQKGRSSHRPAEIHMFKTQNYNANRQKHYCNLLLWAWKIGSRQTRDEAGILINLCYLSNTLSAPITEKVSAWLRHLVGQVDASLVSNQTDLIVSSLESRFIKAVVKLMLNLNQKKKNLLA